MTTMPSGKLIATYKICDEKCDSFFCEDEANCNGYTYGRYCSDHSGTIWYLPAYWVCIPSEKRLCVKSTVCDVTNDTENSCQHVMAKRPVPLFNFTKCGILIKENPNHYKYDSSYCKDTVLSQSNCSDPAKVGLKCLVNGYLTTVSKYLICAGEKACDDEFENRCINTSHDCFIHKHAMCDGKHDCHDKSDESNPICNSMTGQKCQRRVGQGGKLPIPLSWLMDDVVDCIDGTDEDNIWPTCGRGKTLRFLSSGEKLCENVFLCPWGEPGYVKLGDLCDGIETCGNENEVCSESRGSPKISTTVVTTDRGLTKHLSFCIKGIKDTQNFKANCTTIPSFIFPNHDFFGVDSRTAITLPNTSQSCDHMFGEQYVYTTCTNMCTNSPCPLRNIPRYEVCPGQYRNRIGTIANNGYLAFFTKSYGSIYTNRHFVCDNKITCINYSQVCDLVDDCGDGSDEDRCTNHFKCNASGHYIPVTRKCDGAFDCLDLSDECNGQCSARILEEKVLKLLSWAIGALAILANLLMITQNFGTLKNCKTVVVLLNKLLVMTISFGDLLVGCYLFVISIYDGIIFKEGYCTKQISWITSTNCSVIGVLSTIGSQASLFAMCALSIVRIHGIRNSMRIPGELTLVKSLKVAACWSLMILASVSIAIMPISNQFEDYFVNGVRYADELRVFIGTQNKQKLLAIFQAYFGRMKDAQLSWRMMNRMMTEMFSHDYEYKDHTTKIEKVDFYGNDGVCLFKYFVKEQDPQRHLVWAILTLNFLCFLSITVSYSIIGIISHKSSKSLMHSGGNQQISERNRKMNLKITIIITTDFLCWIPFIVICVLHSLEVVDATPWYSLFSMMILPINSVINPLIYDDTVINLFLVPLQRLRILTTNSRVLQDMMHRMEGYTTRRNAEKDCVGLRDLGEGGTAEQDGDGE